MASTRIFRTAGTPTSTKKFTVSFWVKKTAIGADQFVFNATADANNRSQVEFNTDDEMNFICKVSGSNIGRLRTTRKFRDPSAFYHFVAVLDTTESTSSNRMKLYVNGVQETDFITETYPSLNADASVSGTHTIGSYYNGSSASNYLDGLLTHVHFTDGYAYQASTFGSSDSTSGIWKPNTAPSVTYGTNGFFLKFENSGAMGTDSSGNSNTFTVSGSLTQNVDTPSNNFATLNPLDRAANNSTNTSEALSNGNKTFDTTSANNLKIKARGTIGVNSGKYYWEGKYNSGTAWAMGFCFEELFPDTTADFWDSTSILAVAANGGSGTLYINGRASDSFNTGVSLSGGDIFGFALDIDNKGFYVHKNGTYITANGAVGDPTSGSSRTGSVLGELTTGGYQNYIPDNKFLYPFCSDSSSGANADMDMNFGSGYFGTTAVSSAGTAPSEGGIFEYDCPSGYQALCTKGINSF